MTKERGIDDIPVHDEVFGSLPIFLRWGVANPFKVLGFVFWIVQRTRTDPVDLIKSLLLVPRAIAVFKKICDQRPDVVHLYWGHYPSLVGWLLKTYQPEVPITTFIGAYDLEKKYGGTKEILHASKRVFTMAKTNEEPLKEWFGVPSEKVKVIYQSVDYGVIEEYTHSIAEKAGRMISAGRLVQPKRMDDVIRVFASVRDTLEDGELILMGDGPDRERLAALADDLNIRDDVKFLGHVSEERVFTEMARSDIFVFMSDKEGERLPNVVKEAMACRCFCVSSRTPGMEELIDQGTDGYLVDSGDVEEAGRIVRNYTNNNIDENKIKNKAVKKIKQSFSLKESAKSYKRAWKLVSN
jgi:glycosyltransferase involved in cell wall biosynthesis